MVEQIRVKYMHLYVDTNKRTIDEKFSTMKELMDYCKDVEVNGVPLANMLGLNSYSKRPVRVEDE